MYTKKLSSYENYLDMSQDDGFLNVIDFTIHFETVKRFRVESAKSVQEERAFNWTCYYSISVCSLTYANIEGNLLQEDNFIFVTTAGNECPFIQLYY